MTDSAINIQTADENALRTLEGISSSKAKQIITERQEKVLTVDDLVTLTSIDKWHSWETEGKIVLGGSLPRSPEPGKIDQDMCSAMTQLQQQMNSAMTQFQQQMNSTLTQFQQQMATEIKDINTEIKNMNTRITDVQQTCERSIKEAKQEILQECSEQVNARLQKHESEFKLMDQPPNTAGTLSPKQQPPNTAGTLSPAQGSTQQESDPKPQESEATPVEEAVRPKDAPAQPQHTGATTAED